MAERGNPHESLVAMEDFVDHLRESPGESVREGVIGWGVRRHRETGFYFQVIYVRTVRAIEKLMGREWLSCSWEMRAGVAADEIERQMKADEARKRDVLERIEEAGG